MVKKNVFWGIEIDSMNMCLQLPDDKLHQVRKGLLLFKNRTHMKSLTQEQEELQKWKCHGTVSRKTTGA